MASLKRSSITRLLLDPFEPTGSSVDEEDDYRFGGDWRAWGIPLLVGVIGTVATLIGWVTNPGQFYFSYLVGWSFCLTLTLGALFFVLIQHLTRARWSVVVRRLAEAVLWSFPILAMLSIPILLGMHDLYHWTHADAVASDPILAGKEPYLNVPFFLGRFAFYFAIWSLLGYKLYRLSLQEDETGDPSIPARQRKVSAWGLVLTAVTTAFASYDLWMSLDPHWFSTIFGVYIFAGAFMSIHAFLALAAMMIQRGTSLRRTVTREHYQDLGKMTFGFVVFWAYIAFSQYMLIWYGNIPEETVWYRHRLEHGWEAHSAMLLIGHFIVPFLLMLPRSVKRSKPLLGILCVWLLAMQWFDLHWLAMPVLHPDDAGIHLLDVTSWLGLFGLFAASFMYRLSRHPLVPRRSPYLEASLHFENS
jgi:hypothetical protein